MLQNLLLAALKDNDPKAMDQLFNHYWEEVFDTAFKRTGNEEAAQDITQEIFISLWENRTTLSLEGSLSAYLYGAVKFRVINYFRNQAMQAGHHAELSLLMAQDETRATDSKLLLHDLNRQVDQAISSLPERMKQVISMSRKQDKSVKEIAETLGISVQTVKNQITAAMKILRENFSYILVLAFFRL